MTMRLLALLILLVAALPARAELGGVYLGMDEAAGMRLDFSKRGGQFAATLTRRDGGRIA